MCDVCVCVCVCVCDRKMEIQPTVHKYENIEKKQINKEEKMLLMISPFFRFIFPFEKNFLNATTSLNNISLKRV